jgi:hypothetical protein
MLMLPEGDPQRRRHAHTGCVMAARKRGQLPTRAEWLAASARSDHGRQRIAARLRRATG